MNGKCRITGEDLICVHDFGNMYVSDFVDNPEEGSRFPLKLGLGPTSGLLQLYDTYSPEQMYRNYWYMSSINEKMVQHLSGIISTSYRYASIEPGDTVVDIGCNDGTLLSFWDDRLYRIGFDPAENLAVFSKLHADVIISDFFSCNYMENKKAKVITSIAMFYDLENPREFIEEIRSCLHKDGVWICQMSYLPLMLAQNAVDNICAEHLCYYSLDSFMSLLTQCKLQVVDVEVNEINGGSFRIYVKHSDSYFPPIERSIGDFRIQSLLSHESRLLLKQPYIYNVFLGRIKKEHQKLARFLIEARESSKVILGYGASTKGNTLLQYFGIGPTLLPAIADRNKDKHGKYTVGSNIPIISEEEMRKMKPDYLLALPWHFIKGFQEREKCLINQGTRFVVPLPKFEVI
tara:strand:+ start:645 stop:1856 length:1212 start_codon:yes stop_codon:yes gene_type:complete